MPHIVVVGAGVLGLTAALTLVENLPPSTTQISVIAEWGPHLPSMNTSLTTSNEYVSPWAGAHFRPFPSATEKEFEELKLTRKTLQYFQKLASDHPESSVKFVKGVEYLEDPSELYKTCARGYTENLQNFKKLGVDERGFLGFEYDTWVVSPPMYLQYLYRKLQTKYGVKFITLKLDSLQQINILFSEKPKRPIIVNCTGKGLQYSGGTDPAYEPIRGQTLLINPPPDCPYLNKTITYQLADKSWIFTIHRPLYGGVILGGTKQVGDTFLGIREEDTKHLFKLGERYFPSLMKLEARNGKEDNINKESRNGEKYFDVMKVNVALRPARRGGLRIEREKINGQNVIHNYGAGGMGYELSYGASLKVYSLVEEILNESKL